MPVLKEDVAAGQPAHSQPEGAQAPVTLWADEFPLVGCPLPSTQMSSFRPLVGLAAEPPRFLSVQITQHPMAEGLPLGHS